MTGKKKLVTREMFLQMIEQNKHKFDDPNEVNRPPSFDGTWVKIKETEYEGDEEYVGKIGVVLRQSSYLGEMSFIVSLPDFPNGLHFYERDLEVLDSTLYEIKLVV